jgi:Flp pilus assembly protein TadG
MAAPTRVRTPTAGAALVELVVSMPVLIVLLVGTSDFARAFYMSIELTNAARAGAQYGAYNQTQSSDTAKMRATATAAAPNISGMLPPVASRLCQCADDAGVFSPLAGGMTCLSPPAVSCPGLHRVMTVTVTTSATFSTIAGNVGIPGSLVITRTATLRVAEE